MGAAYFIVLDNEEPGFETFVNGKAIARASDSIRSICDKLDLTSIDDLTSFGALDEEFDVPEECRETSTPWFEPREGIEWVGALYEYIEANPSSVKDPDHVLAELDEYEAVFKKAAKIGAKWHLELDI
jgi:hypothetical protein